MTRLLERTAAVLMTTSPLFFFFDFLAEVRRERSICNCFQPHALEVQLFFFFFFFFSSVCLRCAPSLYCMTNGEVLDRVRKEKGRFIGAVVSVVRVLVAVERL